MTVKKTILKKLYSKFHLNKSLWNSDINIKKKLMWIIVSYVEHKNIFLDKIKRHFLNIAAFNKQNNTSGCNSHIIFRNKLFKNDYICLLKPRLLLKCILKFSIVIIFIVYLIISLVIEFRRQFYWNITCDNSFFFYWMSNMGTCFSYTKFRVLNAEINWKAIEITNNAIYNDINKLSSFGESRHLINISFVCRKATIV